MPITAIGVHLNEYITPEAARKIVEHAQKRALLISSGIDTRDPADTCVALVFMALEKSLYFPFTEEVLP